MIGTVLLYMKEHKSLQPRCYNERGDALNITLSCLLSELMLKQKLSYLSHINEHSIERSSPYVYLVFHNPVLIEPFTRHLDKHLNYLGEILDLLEMTFVSTKPTICNFCVATLGLRFFT